jgi:hypothetical protein
MNDLDMVPSGDRPGRVEVGHVGSLVVDVHGLEKSYSGTHVVGGIDLAIRQGEIFALLGPNERARRPPSRFSRGTGPVTMARSAFWAWIPAVSGQS